jgi:hypothetical protein
MKYQPRGSAAAGRAALTITGSGIIYLFPRVIVDMIGPGGGGGGGQATGPAS